MAHNDAVLLAKVLRLLNDHPRFGPRDRRLPFDSYSVAAEVTQRLDRGGYDAAIWPNLLNGLRR